MEVTLSEMTSNELGTAVRAAISSAIETAAEWVDLTAYGVVTVTVSPKLVFPSLATSSALLVLFTVFGAGFFEWPLGGRIYGRLSDKLGRRILLLATLITMGISAFSIDVFRFYSGAISRLKAVSYVPTSGF